MPCMEPMYATAPTEGNADDNMYVLPVPFIVDFNLNGIDNKIPEGVQHPMFQGAQEELLHWHYHLSHLLFCCMKQLA